MFWANVVNGLTIVVAGLVLHLLTKLIDRPIAELNAAFDRVMEKILLPMVSILFVFHVVVMELSPGPATRRDVWIAALLAMEVSMAFTIKLVTLLIRRIDRIANNDQSG